LPPTPWGSRRAARSPTSTTRRSSADDLANAAGKADQTTGVASIPSGTNCAAVTQGIVIDFMQGISLNAPTDFELATLTVAISGTMGDVAAEAGRVVFTDAVGNPATPTVVVHGGASIAPAVQEPAVITFEPKVCTPAAQFTISIDDTQGFGEAVSTVRLNFNADGTNDQQIQGWSYGICSLDTAKLAITAVTSAGTDSATVKNGTKADFDTFTLYAEQGGATHGIVIDFMAAVTLAPVTSFSDLAVTVQFQTTTVGETALIAPCDKTLGAPPTANVMVVGGASLPAATNEDPSDELCPGVVGNHIGVFTQVEDKKSFKPGNANGDAKLDLADGIFILSYLFRSGRAPGCVAALDVNNDGAVDASDAIMIFYWQFLDGPAPALGLDCVKVKTDLSCDVQVECE